MAPLLEATHQRWVRALEDAVDSDQGGQREEAAEEYKHLSSTLSTAQRLYKQQLNDSQLEGLSKLSFCLQLHAQERYQKVYDVPDEMADHSAQISAAMTPSNGTLIPPVTKPLRRGGKLISFDIDKWGFKDDVIKGIQDGYITITMVDGKGNLVGSSQDTPVTSNIGGNYAVFKCQVHIQQSIDKLSPNSALFFEFKCNIARKDAGSAKAFCFIDWDQLHDLQPGKCALEVYRAPAVFSRKTRPQLLSKKPLYLHLNALTQEA